MFNRTAQTFLCLCLVMGIFSDFFAAYIVTPVSGESDCLYE